MENEHKEIDEQKETVQEQPQYTPRPAYQVWAARLGLVIVVVALILYYLHIAQGGL